MSDIFPRLPKSLRTRCAQLTKTKYRREQRRLLLEGSRIIIDALAGGVELESVIVEQSLAHRHHGILDRLEGAAVPVYALGRKEFDSLSDTVTSQGILAVAHQPPMAEMTALDTLGPDATIVVLDHVGDPGNLGTILRSCDWFGIRLLCISPGSTDVFSPKVIRASMGSIFRVPLLRIASIRSFGALLRDRAFHVIAAEAEAPATLRDHRSHASHAVIFGSEAHGISPEYDAWIDERVSIRRIGGGESLNLAVACGIILHALTSPVGSAE